LADSSAEVGLSAFAIQHPKFPCTKFLEAFKGVKSPKIAILDGWFGSDRRCLDRFLALPNSGTKLVQIHIRYVPKSQVEGLDKNLLSARAKKWEHYRIKYPHVRFLLSDGLESHDYSGTAKRRVLFIKKYFHGKIVHNPLNERDPDIVGADYIELHEPRYRKSWGRKTIFNYDGFGVDYRNEGRGRIPFQTSVSAVRSDIAKAKRDGSLVFLWDGPSQGIYDNRRPIDARFRRYEIIGNSIKNDLLKR
jgi:hypothetical protein